MGRANQTRSINTTLSLDNFKCGFCISTVDNKKFKILYKLHIKKCEICKAGNYAIFETEKIN